MVAPSACAAGSQALLLAGAAGAASVGAASMLLLSFVAKRNVYVASLAGVFSLAIGFAFLLGLGTDLPDFREVITAVFRVPRTETGR